MIKPTSEPAYKFEQVKFRIRWVDYMKLRNIFPTEKGESAASYFKRLAKWLQFCYGK